MGAGRPGGDCGPLFQCSSCSQQFMQKKDLQSHMIKLHGAPKPHAVSDREGWACFNAGMSKSELCPEWAAGHVLSVVRGVGGRVGLLFRAGVLVGLPGSPSLLSPWPWSLPLPAWSACSAPPVPSASCLGQSCSCMKLSSTVVRSCLCVRSVGTGPRAGMACRCTSRPSTGACRPFSLGAQSCCQPRLAPAGKTEFADFYTDECALGLHPESSAYSLSGIVGPEGQAAMPGREAGGRCFRLRQASVPPGQILSFLSFL